MGSPELERGLRNIEVRVRYKLGASTTMRFTVKVRPTDCFRKIKYHITQSLDIEGTVTYREQNCDDFPTKRLADYTTKKEEHFHVIAERKPRELKHYNIQLQLPEEYCIQDAAKTVGIKVARTTTIGNLKHKVQDEYGIPVEEMSIHLPGQIKECQPGVNVMQLLGAPPLNLEVKWHKKESSPPPRPAATKRTSSLKSSGLASGTPYAVKPGRRKSMEHSSIHPKSKVEKKSGTKMSCAVMSPQKIIAVSFCYFDI